MSDTLPKRPITGGHVAIILISLFSFIVCIVAKDVIKVSLTQPMIRDPAYSHGFLLYIWGTLLMSAINFMIPTSHLLIFFTCFFRRNPKWLQRQTMILLVSGLIGICMSAYLMANDENKPFGFLLSLSMFHTVIGFAYLKFFNARADDDEERLQQIAGERARSGMKATPVQPNFRYGTFAENSPHHQSGIEPNKSQNISNPEPNPINKVQFPINSSTIEGIPTVIVPETPLLSSINQDFEKAVMFFPHLRSQYDSLKNYRPKVAETFAKLVVEQQKFQDSAAILQTVEAAELHHLFGAEKTLQAYGKELIENGRLEDVKELSDTIRIMGNTVDARKIIKILSSKRRVLLKEIKQLSALTLQYKNPKANNRTETRKAYLAVLSDNKLVGWNPNTDLYEIFTSYDDFSRKTALLVGKFFICEYETDRMKFIDAAGSIKIETNTESPSDAVKVPIASAKSDIRNLYDESIEWLSSYSTIVRTKTGKTEALRIYLAKVADGRIVGYNTDSLRYEFFNSTIEYSEKTKVHHGHFSISRKKEDREDFLKQVRE